MRAEKVLNNHEVAVRYAARALVDASEKYLDKLNLLARIYPNDGRDLALERAAKLAGYIYEHLTTDGSALKIGQTF